MIYRQSQQIVAVLLMLCALCCLGAAVCAADTEREYILNDFETTFGREPFGGRGDFGGSATAELSTAQAKSGTHAVRWQYDFSADGVPTKGAVYGRCFLETPLAGHPTAWVYADAASAGYRLVYRFRDATGRTWQGGLGSIDWTGWKQLSGPINPTLYHWAGTDTPDGGFSYPLVFSEFCIEGGTPTSPTTGTLYLDDVRVQGEFAANELLQLAVTSTWTDNIGVGTNPGVAVQVNNRATRERALTIRWTLTDSLGKVASSERRVQAKPIAVTDIALPLSLPHRGLYTLAITVTDPADPAWRIARTCALASVSPVSAAIDPASPFGVNGHSSGLHMKPLGVGFTRADWPWQFSQPDGPETWTFAEYDRQLAEINGNGLDILPVLGYSPTWAKPAAGQGTDHGAFLAYIRRTIERYKGRVHYWDLWNEPDLSWKGGRQEFGDLMYEAYKIIKEVDPKARVIYPGCSDGDFHSELKAFTLPSLASFNGRFPFDVLAVHPYSRPKSSDEVQMREHLLALRKLLDQNGRHIPIWISECGWPTATDRSSVSEEVQAAYLARLYIIGLSAGVEKIVYYQPFSGDNPDDPESHYGYLRSDYTPKPAATALAQVSYRLKQAKFEREITLGDALRCYVFRTPSQLVATLYAVGQPVEVSLSLPQSVTIEAIDGSPLPRPAKTLRVGTSPLYLLAPVGNSAALLKALQAARATGIAPLSVSSSLVADRYLIRLQNRVNRAVAASVAVQWPAGWQPTGANTPHRVTVPPAGQAMVEVPITVPVRNALGAVGITVTAEERTDTFSVPVRTLPIARVPSPITVDGDLREWQGQPPTITLTKSTDIMPQPMQLHWRGVSDLSARGWWAWNAQGLYLALDVEDNVHLNTQHGTGIYAGDGIQVAVDTSTGVTPQDYSSASEFGCALTDTGVETWNWVGKALAGGQAIVRRDATTHHTYYELFATWQALNIAPPSVGAVLGMNVIVNEDDGQGRKSWLECAPGIGEAKNPSLYPRCILTDTPGQQ